MGAIFRKLESYIAAEPGSVFVEIGSDRGEGSTYELDRLAGLHNTKLITVDVLTTAKQHFESQLSHTDFVIASGGTWAQKYSGPPISVLYLDNFDYNWDINEDHKPTKIQMAEYASRGETMNNQNSQVEHMTQMLALYSHLTADAVVMFDDTYQVNDCWIGKCGPAVVYLLACGWEVVHRTTDCGVILTRRKK